MKRITLLSAALLYSCIVLAQRTIQLRNLWAEPQVHVVFDGFVVSFTIKDINRAIQLLAEAGDSTYGTTSHLDTAKQYTTELFAGYNTEYRDKLQPLLQKGVGAFLLTSGHALIENSKHKKLKGIVVDAQPYDEGEHISDVKFYDINSRKLLFNGQLPAELFNKDIGIE